LQIKAEGSEIKVSERVIPIKVVRVV